MPGNDPHEAEAPDPDEYISLRMAADSTGLARSTLLKQVKVGRIQGGVLREDAGIKLAVHWRGSGGGPAQTITRGALHDYLLGRQWPDRGGGTGPKPIKRSYKTPAGRPPLPDKMLEPEETAPAAAVLPPEPPKKLRKPRGALRLLGSGDTA